MRDSVFRKGIGDPLVHVISLNLLTVVNGCLTNRNFKTQCQQYTRQKITIDCDYVAPLHRPVMRAVVTKFPPKDERAGNRVTARAR